MKTASIVAVLVVAAGLLNGCASCFSRSSYPVAVNSSPSGQPFTVTDYEGRTVARGVTPAKVDLDAHRAFCVPARYSVNYGSAPNASQTVKADVDPWVFANLFIGGVPGLLVDGMTGAMYKLPNSVDGPSYAGVATGEPAGTATIQPAGYTE